MGCGADLIALIFFSRLRDRREETLHSELVSTDEGVGRMHMARGISSTLSSAALSLSTRRFLAGGGVRAAEVSISKESFRRRFPRLNSLL